ncbi:50S ribosomal protein L37ae [Candidatus Woesearchaeota archaeon]|nr:50S ribosomal protein L37ae [Candidatus Woesearchaeota archaeon]
MVKHEGSSKTFGPRYGWTIKKKYDKIMQEQKALHKCPYCNKEKVKRVSTGIWHCGGCSTKFTSKAYTVAKTKV